MRTLILTAAILFVASATLFAQTEVPPEVEDAFDTRFPAAEDVVWEMEAADVYEADFEQNGQEVSALFAETGEWLETETAITTEQLPDVITKVIQEKMPDHEIMSMESIESNDGDITYEVVLENGDESVEIVFSAGGDIIKKEASKDDDDEEEGED